MGTGLNRIEQEFILKNLLDRNTPVEVHAHKVKLNCKFEDIQKDFIILSEQEQGLAVLKKSKQVSVFFNFRGHVMTFQSEVLNVKERTFTISLPEGVYRDLTRDFERVFSPVGISISFTILGKEVKLNYPDTDSYEPLDEPISAAGFDASNIGNLLRAFREKAQAFSTENKIIMFRERQPNSFEEMLISTSGRIFLFPASLIDAPLNPALPLGRILTRENVIKIETDKGQQVFSLLAKLASLVEDKKKKGIKQELYCPILYHQYVVGYLYLVTTKKEYDLFSRRTLDFVIQFARILAYSLKATGYFKASPIKETFNDAELIDISGSGLLFSFPPSKVDKEFVLYSDFEFIIHIGERKLPVVGRIVRKYKDKHYMYIAVKFLEIQNDDFEFLLRSIYGEDYSSGFEKTQTD